MKIRFIILLIFFNQQEFFAQNSIERVYEVINYQDSTKRTLVKETFKDSNGKILEERLNGFYNIGSNEPLNAIYLNQYDESQLTETFFTNLSNGDTIVTNYSYKKNRIVIEKKELIEESRIKEGLVYGDGTENGCIVPPEALEYYKTWVVRRKQKTILIKGKTYKDLVYFNYGTNAYNVEYSYDSNNRLMMEKNISRDIDQINWIRTYKYESDKTTIKRKFFIEYWNKIPPNELIIKYLNKHKHVEKIEMVNMKDQEDSIITFEYQNDGKLSNQTWLTQDGEIIRQYEFDYITKE